MAGLALMLSFLLWQRLRTELRHSRKAAEKEITAVLTKPALQIHSETEAGDCCASCSAGLDHTLSAGVNPVSRQRGIQGAA